MIKVLIVEDSRISRDLIEIQLNSNKKYEIIASIENAANAEIICMKNKVDLVLMDICTADNESGLVAAEKIKSQYPEIKVIIMTSMPEYSFMEKAIKAGCDSFWYKEEEETDLIDICDKTVAGEFIWPIETPVVKIGMTTSDNFTKRELDVISELAKGYKYEEVASHLFMSTNTVKYHVRNILQKTGFHNTVQLIAAVIEKRLVLPRF